MGWFAEIDSETPCPICGESMGKMQTKGWDEDEYYYMEHGKPYLMSIEEAFKIASETNEHGVTSVEAISSCDKCHVYAHWTLYSPTNKSLLKGDKEG